MNIEDKRCDIVLKIRNFLSHRIKWVPILKSLFFPRRFPMTYSTNARGGLATAGINMSAVPKC